MSYKKTLLIVGLAAIFFSMSLGSQAYAGGGFDPPPWCASVGDEPTLWGVVVVDCTQGVATGRVKKIDNCEVQTFSYADGAYAGTCPETEADAINSGVQLVPFAPVTNANGVGASGVVITKAKNLQVDGSSVSFDAQFKYCYPVP